QEGAVLVRGRQGGGVGDDQGEVEVLPVVAGLDPGAGGEDAGELGRQPADGGEANLLPPAEDVLGEAPLAVETPAFVLGEDVAGGEEPLRVGGCDRDEVVPPAPFDQADAPAHQGIGGDEQLRPAGAVAQVGQGDPGAGDRAADGGVPARRLQVGGER